MDLQELDLEGQEALELDAWLLLIFPMMWLTICGFQYVAQSDCLLLVCLLTLLLQWCYWDCFSGVTGISIVTATLSKRKTCMSLYGWLAGRCWELNLTTLEEQPVLYLSL